MSADYRCHNSDGYRPAEITKCQTRRPLHGRREPMYTAAMTVDAINHIALICSDYERSKNFYVHKPGFTVKVEHYRKERKSYDLEISGVYQIELFSFENNPKGLSYSEASGLRHPAFPVQIFGQTFQNSALDKSARF